MLPKPRFMALQAARKTRKVLGKVNACCGHSFLMNKPMARGIPLKDQRTVVGCPWLLGLIRLLLCTQVQ